MGTRSLIGLLNEDGTVRSVYCHWDGYPSHNGFMLQNHYNSPQMAARLLDHGDISVLSETFGTKHAFDGPATPKDQCTFYHRDRGDKLNIDIDPDEESFWTGESWAEYRYLWKSDGWYVGYGGRTTDCYPLSAVLANMRYSLSTFIPKGENGQALLEGEDRYFLSLQAADNLPNDPPGENPKQWASLPHIKDFLARAFNGVGYKVVENGRSIHLACSDVRVPLALRERWGVQDHAGILPDMAALPAPTIKALPAPKKGKAKKKPLKPSERLRARRAARGE